MIKVFKVFKHSKLYYFLLVIFLMINSCDDNKILLSENSTITTNYKQISFNLDINQSILPNSPIYLNQDLSSRVYVGNIDENNISYAIFEVKTNILSKYNLCSESILNDEIDSVDSILFRIVFDSPIKKSNDYSLNISPNELNLANDFNFEEEVDNDSNMSFFMNSYFTFFNHSRLLI